MIRANDSVGGGGLLKGGVLLNRAKPIVQGTGFFRGSSRGSFTRISGFCLWVLVWNRSTTASARLLTIFNEDKEITRERFARRANEGGAVPPFSEAAEKGKQKRFRGFDREENISRERFGRFANGRGCAAKKQTKQQSPTHGRKPNENVSGSFCRRK